MDNPGTHATLVTRHRPKTRNNHKTKKMTINVGGAPKSSNVLLLRHTSCYSLPSTVNVLSVIKERKK